MCGFKSHPPLVLSELSFSTSAKEQLLDITAEINAFVKKAGMRDGLCYLYVPHATAGITVNESADPAVGRDLLAALDRAAPRRAGWEHDRIDNNAAAHIKSSLVGVSAVIPVRGAALALGRWQAIFLCEFDGPRKRKVLIELR